MTWKCGLHHIPLERDVQGVLYCPACGRQENILIPFDDTQHEPYTPYPMITRESWEHAWFKWATKDTDNE